MDLYIRFNIYIHSCQYPWIRQNNDTQLDSCVNHIIVCNKCFLLIEINYKTGNALEINYSHKLKMFNFLYKLIIFAILRRS